MAFHQEETCFSSFSAVSINFQVLNATRRDLANCTKGKHFGEDFASCSSRNFLGTRCSRLVAVYRAHAKPRERIDGPRHYSQCISHGLVGEEGGLRKLSGFLAVSTPIRLPGPNKAEHTSGELRACGPCFVEVADEKVELEELKRTAMVGFATIDVVV